MSNFALDKKMKSLNASKPEQAFKSIDDYISYMYERINYSFENVGRIVSQAGTSSVELLILIIALQDTTAALKSELATLQGTVNTNSEQIKDHETRIKALEAKP